MPFITDVIWRKLYGDNSIHREKFPNKIEVPHEEYKVLLDLFMKLNSKIWTYKKKNKIALNQPLKATVYVPEELKPLVYDLKIMHRVSEILTYKEKPKIEKLIDLGDGIYLKLEE